MFNKKPEIVSCEKCKLLLNKADAQKIPVESFWSLLDSGSRITYIYFCPKDRVDYESITEASYGKNYFKNFRVNEDGTPLGYKLEKK